MADDFIEAQSRAGSDIECFDPLSIIELVIEANASWGWMILIEIIERDKYFVSFETLMGGPMYSWMKLYAADWVEIIECEISSNVKFKKALSFLPTHDLDDRVRRCIEAAIG